MLHSILPITILGICKVYGELKADALREDGFPTAREEGADCLLEY